MPAILLFEALPPRVDASEPEWQDHLDLLEPLRKAGLAGVNVPEIVNGGYVTVEPRAFAAGLARDLGLRPIVNRITVHHPLPSFLSWTTQTRAGFGIRDLILVGGERSTDSYPGPSVTEALEAVRPGLHRSGGTLGVITIPNRRRKQNDEPERLLRKAHAGASYAVSQILCEAGAASQLQADTAQTARASSSPAPQLVWSLAPVAKKRDLEFLRWLGVDVPTKFENTILDETGVTARISASHRHNEALARTLLEHAETHNLPIPGFSVEHVMLSNIEAALELVERIRLLCKDHGGLTPHLPPEAIAMTA